MNLTTNESYLIIAIIHLYVYIYKVVSKVVIILPYYIYSLFMQEFVVQNAVSEVTPQRIEIACNALIKLTNFELV